MVAIDPGTLRRATAHLRSVDPVLGAIMARVGPCRYQVERGGGPFGALVESIVYQQLAGYAAASIHARVVALCASRTPQPRDIARATDIELRAAGLSRQKVGYLRDLVARVEDGLPLHRLARQSDEKVIETLTTVKGIGRWTAEMFLMFRLGRLDILPVDDYGVRKAMQKAWRKRALPKAQWMRGQAEPWRPYRSIASWYLWRSLDLKSD
jgi:DNA-3-methyladenine glycosylase II